MNLSDQERQQPFIDEYNALTQKYGLTFGAQLKPEQLGMVVQVRPELVLMAVEGWKAPQEEQPIAKVGDWALDASPELESAHKNGRKRG